MLIEYNCSPEKDEKKMLKRDCEKEKKKKKESRRSRIGEKLNAMNTMPNVVNAKQP